ncbi:fasciclin domain-containing protein [Ferruginibacter lapsinanis]|uniref:fasciclin domain-containing protein n=1 Tax=Ferruginibacter lapsinanis TaxID=563172 RepID=UPI001E50D718|nr:fasciclin domain-containing protein [Ferruginibacter lapsinanis]UEG50131.1 fasciclin domain-containing protein [Ferruginibacter lapsinanis]
MKREFKIIFTAAILTLAVSCNSNEEPKTVSPETAANTGAGQSAVQDDQSAKNVVQVAVGSKDHTTLVTALKAADLVDALSNAGPFTVFAPTNAAFDKLPAGTVDGLLKPEKKDALTDILQYHVSVGVFKEDMLQDGQVIGQVNGGNISISKKDGKIMVNGTANVIAAIPASNGIVYVIDQVLLPPPAQK